MRHRAPRAVTIAVTSGKGGVGKSNLAVNLSISLASQGLRVTLADVDMGLANADVLMNLHPVFTLAHVLSGIRSIDEISMDGPGGIRFVPGASGLDTLANLTDFERGNLLAQLSKLNTSTEIVVLDCGAGISRNVLAFATSADHVIVVSTPQPTAMTDAYAMIKALHRHGHRGEITLVVNMAASFAEARSAHHRIAGVARKFLNLTIAEGGYLLHDRCVDQAVRERCPFVIRYPGSNAAACMHGIAASLARRFTMREARRGGFLKKVVGLFT